MAGGRQSYTLLAVPTGLPSCGPVLWQGTVNTLLPVSLLQGKWEGGRQNASFCLLSRRALVVGCGSACSWQEWTPFLAEGRCHAIAASGCHAMSLSAEDACCLCASAPPPCRYNACAPNEQQTRTAVGSACSCISPAPAAPAATLQVFISDSYFNNTEDSCLIPEPGLPGFFAISQGRPLAAGVGPQLGLISTAHLPRVWAPNHSPHRRSLIFVLC